MQPLMSQSTQARKRTKSDVLQKRTRTLSAMLEQIDDFADTELVGEPARPNSNHETDAGPAAPRTVAHSVRPMST